MPESYAFKISDEWQSSRRNKDAAWRKEDSKFRNKYS